MGIWFNKWLLTVLVVLPVFKAPKTEVVHPLHLGVVEIEYNSQDQALEITCKLFTDDFENILEKIYNTDIDLINPPDREAVQKWVNAYIKKHLVISANGKQANLECIGFERDHEATFSYFQATGIRPATAFVIQNSLMYDLFDDQSNIVHVKVNGTRKSNRLKYPQKDMSVNFSNPSGAVAN